jgi:SAM-dependent methyltransferase
VREILLQWLRCPACKGRLSLHVHARTGCGLEYPILRSIPRFVSSDQYAGNFSYQWNLFARTRTETTPDRFTKHTGLAPGDLAGKLVLEAGVGTGRFADVAERAGATVIGIDLSLSVEAARDNLRGRNAHIVQASIFALPFAPETFDIVYSIGVLHHTPDCRKAFLALPPLARPGGTVAICVYGTPASSTALKAERFWRSITTRLPNRLLLALCAAGTAVGYLRSIPLVRPLLRWALPGFVYDCLPLQHYGRGFVVRTQKTFDHYSPKYQSRHTYPEVSGWFEEAGLQGIRILPHRISVLGRKPGASSVAQSAAEEAVYQLPRAAPATAASTAARGQPVD